MKESSNKRNLYINLSERLQAEEKVVLATVTEAQGSTPQEQGCSAIFDEDGLLSGTIGGGRVEHQIQKKAAAAVKSKKSGYYSFDLKDDIDEPDSAICGGGMNILLDSSPEKHRKVFESLKKSYSNRIPGVLVTLANAAQQGDFDIQRFWITDETELEKITKLNPEAVADVKKMLVEIKQHDFRKIVMHTSPDYADSYIFLEKVAPLPQLIIAGAGHVGKALSHHGKLLGFDVIVWDDRDEYANENNLPDADIVLTGELDQTLAKMKVTQDTFIVTVTRGHKQDSDVLKKFIGSRAGYIGMIGSRKKVIQVKEKSLKEGWATTKQWENIHAPIGLDINSKTVEEIAVSIAAELIQERYKLNHRNG